MGAGETMVSQNIGSTGNTESPFDITFFGAPFEAIGKAGIGLPEQSTNETIRREMQTLGMVLADRLMHETPKGVTKKLGTQIRPRHTVIPGSRSLHGENAPSTSGDVHVLEIVQDASTETSDGYNAEFGIESEDGGNRKPTDSFRYRGVVGTGRRPGGGMPPWKLFRPWVMMKWGLTAKESNRAAFTLAQSIQRKGTEPNPFIDRVIQKSRPEFKNAAMKIGRNLRVLSVDRMQRAFDDGKVLADMER